MKEIIKISIKQDYAREMVYHHSSFLWVKVYYGRREGLNWENLHAQIYVLTTDNLRS
jgi:hypothetical protein